MPETLQTNYESLSDMDRTRATGSWKKFFVFVTGKTEGAHVAWVRNLKGVGQTEVDSPGESDYLLVFCPITSRAGTNITEALDSVPGDKPIILVLMHPTFDPYHPVPGTWADSPMVSLTVDCLFYRGELLECSRNDTAWLEVQKFVGVSIPQELFMWRFGLVCAVAGWIIYMINPFGKRAD